MKKKRFSTEQIAAVLHQADGGIPVVELCRQVGIAEQTFYRVLLQLRRGDVRMDGL